MKWKIALFCACIVLLTTVLLLPWTTYTFSPQESSTNLLKVSVCDLEGKPLQNATVTVLETGQKFLCDNQGRSPLFEIETQENHYGRNLDWFLVTLLIEKEGYVNTAIVNCVIYVNQTRQLTVKMYQADQSALPFVCLVESPPETFLQSLFGQKE